MDLLLDTHAFLWWIEDDKKLGPKARGAITRPENAVLVSAATAWEIAVKRTLGKLELRGDIARAIADSQFAELPITVEHAVAAGELPNLHRDPFDRALIAQARIEDLTLLTQDEQITQYDVAVLDARL